MKLLRLMPMSRLKGLIILLGLGLTLLVSQVGWSSADAIAPQALVSRLGTPQAPLILDVRSEAEYQEGHIPGAINIPYREVPDRLSEIADFTPREVVVYCEVGVRAGIAELALEQAGFESIRHLDGDMRRWRQESLPLETD
ncbi:MAG: rhodanese-like domain-containing protein [Cyanobacteria bacterium J06626_18]